MRRRWLRRVFICWLGIVATLAIEHVLIEAVDDGAQTHIIAEHTHCLRHTPDAAYYQNNSYKGLPIAR